MNCSALQLGLPDWPGNMAQSDNPGGELRRVSDIPMQKCEGPRCLRSDGVGLQMTVMEKYKLGLSFTAGRGGVTRLAQGHRSGCRHRGGSNRQPPQPPHPRRPAQRERGADFVRFPPPSGPPAVRGGGGTHHVTQRHRRSSATCGPPRCVRLGTLYFENRGGGITGGQDQTC